MTMCLGWEPRMHNAPVKNEEAFIPIAFHVMSTFIITICLALFSTKKPKCGVWTEWCWSYLWVLLVIWVDFTVRWIGQSNQYLNVVGQPFWMKMEEYLAWQGKTPGKSNGVLVTVTSAWWSSSPGCWSQCLCFVSIQSLHIWDGEVLRF